MWIRRVVRRLRATGGGAGRRSSKAALLLPVGLLLPVAHSSASVALHTAEEVLSAWIERSGDATLFFRSPEGDVWELVPDPGDPAIRNKGEGSFFPPEVDHVRSALVALTYPTEVLSVEIFILPYPRRELLTSSSGRSTIYLSPGVSSYSEAQVHAIVAHEMGHLLHNQRMDGPAWDEYRQLRGLGDRSVYYDAAPHRDRPHEIFAEDFRFLFGGPLANYGGGIENPDLILPDRVEGLAEFFRSRSSAVPASGAPRPLRILPNPARGDVRIALAGESAGIDPTPLVLQIFDAQGRRHFRRELAGSSPVSWDGILEDGTPAPSGLYFVQVLRGRERWSGKLLLAR